jgi:hypothetical protein
MNAAFRRHVFLIAAISALGCVPASANPPAPAVGNYQPYYYVPAQTGTPMPEEDMPVSATAQPSVETYPVAPSPAPAAVTAPPSTVRNLNDELPASMRAPPPPPVMQPAPVAVPTPAPAPAPLPAPAAVMAPPAPMPGSNVHVGMPVPADTTVSPGQAPPPHAQYPTTRSPDMSQPVTLDQLPSYRYNPDYDTSRKWTTPPAKDPKAAGGSIGLETLPGPVIGLQFSDYRYEEHSGDPSTDFARELGPKGGLTFAYTGTFPGDYFITGDLRGAYGVNDYHGTGSANGIPDWLFELRLLGGTDFVFENAFWNTTDFDLTPYAGLGFRMLYNNFAEVSGGYDRYSHYLYIPVGLTPRFRLTEKSRLSVNMEYDHLLYGWQESDLSDGGTGEPDLINPQSNGYGLRGSVMWEWPHWSFGPFIDYWNIGHSNSTCSAGTVFVVCGDEPSNQTLEGGMQVNYRF